MDTASTTTSMKEQLEIKYILILLTCVDVFVGDLYVIQQANVLIIY